MKWSAFNFGNDFSKQVDIDTDCPENCGICETRGCEKLLKVGGLDRLG